MKIVSWNVNSVRARINNVLDYIKTEKPDILFLQEIKTENLNFPSEEFKKIEKDDVVFNKTIIDNSSLEIINGSVVDYQKEMIGSSFVIKNPQAASSCGCGLSFSV